MSTNAIEYGISNVYYSVTHYDGVTDVTKYDKPKLLKGATSLALEILGKTTIVYADNIPYYAGANHQGYSGTLTITSPTSEFLTEVFNMATDENKANIEYSNTVINEIALGFEVDGDQEKRRIWLYRVAINRPTQEHKTKNDTLEADNWSFALNVLPRQSDQAVKAFINEKDSAEIFQKWFEDVYTITNKPEEN